MLIIVPARKGSKGVPGKNSKEFRGFPLVEWSIAAAMYLAKRLNAGVLCTTDDADIARILADHYGGRVRLRDRPPELAGDVVGMAEVVLDACDTRGATQYLLLQPTSPLRLISDLDAFSNEAQRHETVVSCTEPSEHPKDLITLSGDTGHALLDMPKTVTRQESEAEYRFVDGSLYYGQVRMLRESGSFTSEDTRYLTLSNPAAVDIDTPYDWHLAEAQHDWLISEGQSFVRPDR